MEVTQAGKVPGDGCYLEVYDTEPLADPAGRSSLKSSVPGHLTPQEPHHPVDIADPVRWWGRHGVERQEYLDRMQDLGEAPSLPVPDNWNPYPSATWLDKLPTKELRAMGGSTNLYCHSRMP